MTEKEQPNTAGRGRGADRPSEIPMAGWRDIALRVKDEIGNDNVSVVAAGVAFYSVLALFPALAALVSLYGMVADPAQIQGHIDSMQGVLPQDVLGTIEEQLNSLSSESSSALSFGAIGGLLFSLWSATKGLRALIASFNIAYDEDEQRGFVKIAAISLLLTAGAIIFMIVAIGLITLLPIMLGALGLTGWLQTLLGLLRWPLLALMLVFGLAVLYRYAPCRSKPQWRWVTWGSAIATVLWVIGSIAFSLYVENFASYNETYGSIGTAIVLLMWFYVSGYVIVLGAEINAEMERQTRADTTVPPDDPMGERGAYAANTLGESP